MLAVYTAGRHRGREHGLTTVSSADVCRMVHDHREDEPPLPMFAGLGCRPLVTRRVPDPIGPADLS
ncbi:hypothetical protein JS562_50955 [Agrobacterium sp. S2]|nr:hypothetical protein [Agrobacterium sp. S2]